MIAADAQSCPSCLTDLTLFDIGGDSSGESSDVRVTEGKSIDDILASIMDGKTEPPEIFETLKSVAKDHRSTKDLVVEAEPIPAPAIETKEDAQFLCPVCDSAVRPDDKVCPGCGAEFSEGSATEYECPVCKAAVPADADHCPSCGVRFAAEEEGEAVPPEPEVPEPAPPEPVPVRPPAAAAARPAVSPPAPTRSTEALRLGMGPKVANLQEAIRAERRAIPFGDRTLIARELPRLVNEVKPLLVSAKRIGVQIEDGKRQINGAVEAGKRKEMEKAVRLISDARRSLDIAFVDHIGRQIVTLASQVEAAGAGDAATLARPQIEGAFAKLARRDYNGAWDGLQSARLTFQSQAKEYTEGRKILDATERLLGEVRSLGMDAKDVDKLIRQSRDAGARRDLPGSLRLARQAQERLLQSVPDFVQAEMHEARDHLLDMKMRGGDLSKPVGILKEASAHVKNEEWSEAIRFLKEFQKEISKVPKG